MSQFLLAVKARLEISIISLRKQEILVSKRLVPSCLLTVGRKGKESEGKREKIKATNKHGKGQEERREGIKKERKKKGVHT